MDPRFERWARWSEAINVIDMLQRGTPLLLPLFATAADYSGFQRLVYEARFLDRVLGWASVPLLALLVALLVLAKRYLPARREAWYGASLDSDARLEPLRCPGCAAPVPLTPTDAPCPYCHVTVPVPPAYASLLSRRAVAGALLRRLVRRIRIARVTCAFPVELLLYVAGAVLFPLAMTGAFASGGDPPIAPLSNVLQVLAFLGGLSVSIGLINCGYALRGARESFAPFAWTRGAAAAAAIVPCSHCGAPLAFTRGQIDGHCGYCGGETLRGLALGAAQATANRTIGGARQALLNVSNELDDRFIKMLESMGYATFGVLALTAFFVFYSVVAWLEG